MTSAIRLDPIAFDNVPGWVADDLAPALAAFRVSAERLLAIGDVAPPLTREFLAKAASDPGEARSFFESSFVAHTVRPSGADGLLTGYFEPEYRGSRRRQGPFVVPVYARPPDLVNLVDEADRAAANGGFSHMRATPEGLVPYQTRREIENGALAHRGLEIAWLADPVDAFILHVQGSGQIVLEDGTVLRLAYDGKNGHPYTSVGRVLIERGDLPADELTLDVMTSWLRADPARGRAAMWHNESFVFFRELPADEPGPVGAKGIRLTPDRSLAVDPSFHRLGLPIFVDAPTLDVGGRPFRRLMIAQDVGSAIRGPERGDIYFGAGPEAGRLAGQTKHPGRFFVLLPRVTP
ncbi:MAG: murein transglycosylase A [Hyphomicrobiaceae bacterium]